MLYSEAPRYTNIIPANAVANATSIPVFSVDFEKMQFTLQYDGSANYNIKCIKSNQELPPDPTLSISSTNQYEFVAFQDEDSEVTYTSTAPFNPHTAASGGTALSAGAKNFVVQTSGARWFFVQLSGYVAGTLVKCDAFVFTGN